MHPRPTKAHSPLRQKATCFECPVFGKNKEWFLEEGETAVVQFGLQYSLRAIFPQSKCTEKQVTSVGMEPRATQNAVGGTKDVHVSGSPLLSEIVLTLGYPWELGVGERDEGG